MNQNNRMKTIKRTEKIRHAWKIFSYRACLCLLLFTFSSLTTQAQTISQISKSDPLIITGTIGTQNTYYHSSMGNGYASPLSNSVFANLNISLYGISMPFSFYYSNNNLDFNYPHFSFNLSPVYKNWTGHLGRSTMAFSNYVMNMSFNGVGVEYNSNKLRFGAFYGQLRNAINDDPDDPKARRPQYKRMAWGFKVGYGNAKNALDLYLLRAYDRPNSLDERWHDVTSPQENLVVGLRGLLTPMRWLSLTGNLAVSAFSLDMQAEKIRSEETGRFDKIFDARYSSLARLAGDFNMNLTLKNFRTSVFYRMIQPDYTSLGTYYMSNNYQSLGVNMNTMLFKKVALSATFSGQEDNLSKKQLYTTRGFVYSANASTSLGKRLTLSAGFNGYLQTQGDGTMHVNDTTRIHRIMSSFYFTPTYSLPGSTLDHMFSVSFNLSQNKDLNRFANGQSDVTTVAAGLTHSMSVKPWEMNFTTALNHQQSQGYNTRYSSDILSVTADRAFLKEKNLTVSATASLCYNNIKDQQRSLSMGADMSMGYTLKQVHAFSLNAGVNKYSDANLAYQDESYNTTEFSMSLNYTYTFTLLEIKRHAEKDGKSKNSKKVKK